eukprot:CCRYP_011619-RA/>CCRYP_011619-RA protein AED:0.03 eAED:0.03 QI:428/1/1/1/0/0/2/125/265
MPNPDSSHRASDGSSDKDGKKEDDSNSSNCDDNGLSQSNANTSEMKKSAETTETSEKNAKDEEITDDAVRDSDTSDVDEIDRKIEEAASDWQKSASKYVKEHIKPESRYKLKKFIDNEMLNKIRLDKSLNHLPKSIGSYVDAKDGRLTPSGKNARERAKSSEQQAEGVDNQEKKAVKVRKCPPRCIVCCAIADPRNKETKISQTTIYCSTCLVHLCTKQIGNRKTTCFERFHRLPDLSQLSRDKNINVGPSTPNGKRKRSEGTNK